MVKYINIQFYRINVLGVNCPGSNVGGGAVNCKGVNCRGVNCNLPVKVSLSWIDTPRLQLKFISNDEEISAKFLIS